MKSAFLILLACCAIPLHAQSHPFYDTPAKVQVSVAVALAVTDVSHTCYVLAHGGREVWIPTQNCRTLVGLGFAAGAAQEITAFALHRHGHHKLERLTRFISISGNTAGLIASKRNGW